MKKQKTDSVDRIATNSRLNRDMTKRDPGKSNSGKAGAGVPASARQLLDFLSTTDDLVYFLSSDKLLHGISATCKKFTGYSATDIESNPNLWAEIVHPDDYKLSQRLGPEELKGSSSLEMNYRLHHKQGDWRWMHSHLMNIEDETGNHIGFVCLDRETTGQRVAEQRLLDSEEKLKLLVTASAKSGGEFFETMAVQLAKALEADYTLIGEFSLGAVDKIVTLAASADGKLIENFEYNLADSPCAKVVGQAMCTYPSGVAKRFPKDSLLQQMEVEAYIGVPLSDSHGNAIGLMVALFRNRLEHPEFGESILQIFSARTGSELQRMRTEQALGESKVQYQTLIETMNDGVGIQDQDGVMTYANDRLCRILGADREQIIGQLANSFLNEANQAIFEEQTARRRAGKDKAYEITWTRPDGTLVPTIVSPAAILDANGKYAGSFAVVTDITELKKSEVAVLESQEKFQRLSEAAFEAIAISDQGIVIEGNQQVADLLGYSMDELIGMNLIEFVAPESRDVVLQNVRVGGEEAYEHLAIKKDGTIFPVEVHARAMSFKGRVIRVTAIRDLTERRQAEEAIKLAKERFESLISTIPDAVYSTLAHDSGTTTFMSRRWQDWTGYSPDEYYKDSQVWARSIHPDDRQRVVKEFEDACRRGVEFLCDYRLVHRETGEIRHVRDHGVPVLDASGRLLRLEGIVSNITGQVRSNENLERLFNLSDFMICISDMNGYFVRVNKAFEDVLGYTKAELLSRPYLDLVHPDDRERTVTIAKEKLEAGHQIIGFDNRYLCKDGTYKWLAWSSRPVEGEGIAFAIAFDITERKRAEQALADKNVALREILGQIAAEKEDVRQQIATNLGEAVLPTLNRIKEVANPSQVPLLKLMEQNLEAISSPFLDILRSRHPKLSPRETEVCRFIKSGMSSKEIAETLNLSLTTVHKHRELIRRKLGLANVEVNLASYLRSL